MSDMSEHLVALRQAWEALGDAPQELSEIVGKHRGADEGERLRDLFQVVAWICEGLPEEPR